MHNSVNVYHYLRKLSPAKAREFVLNKLAEYDGNISKTARALNISRNTVRRAKTGPLEDLSRAPKTVKNKTPAWIEDMILNEFERTGYGYKRLSDHLYRAKGVTISPSTVRDILYRHKMKPKRVRTKNKEVRRLYNYAVLEPYEQMQADTKHILDAGALPRDVYENIKRKDLPLYEWNIIDAKTRMRFTAYSYRLNSTLGMIFLLLVIMWLRMHNVRRKIKIRVDNGSEWFSGSSRKRAEMNRILGLFNAEVYNIPPGAKHLMGIIENSHRKDDECFLVPYGNMIKDYIEFLDVAQRWQDKWNKERSNFGVEMGGKTPLEKLEEVHDGLINLNVVNFPVLLLEEVQYIVKSGVLWLTRSHVIKPLFKGGKYLPDRCHFENNPHTKANGYYTKNLNTPVEKNLKG